MFRPFPADLIVKLLKGKKAVAILERTDQPLAVDLPMVREVRAAMAKAVENGRSRNGARAHANLPAIGAEDVPQFFSGVFGMGSRDLQPGDVIAAVDNMLPDGQGRRLFYLGIDFIRKRTRLPKLQIWQEKLLESYPDLSDLALDSAGDINLMPEGSVSIRIHSIGGWGAITTGKNLAMTAFELLGWHIKANPKYGSEKKGQPTTFYGTLAKEPIRLNSELKHVDVVLSPDPNVFRHSNPLAGRRALARSQCVPSLEPAGRAFGRRRVHHPDRPDAGAIVGDVPGKWPARDQREEHQGPGARRLQDRFRRGLRSRAALPDAGRGVHGWLLQGLAADGARGAGRREAVRGDQGPAEEEVRPPGRTSSGRQRSRDQARLR
jgi:hypothetical protein